MTAMTTSTCFHPNRGILFDHSVHLVSVLTSGQDVCVRGGISFILTFMSRGITFILTFLTGFARVKVTVQHPVCRLLHGKFSGRHEARPAEKRPTWPCPSEII